MYIGVDIVILYVHRYVGAAAGSLAQTVSGAAASSLRQSNLLIPSAPWHTFNTTPTTHSHLRSLSGPSILMPFASKAQRDRLRRIPVRAKAKLGPRAPAPKAPGGKPTLKSSPLLRCLFKAKTELTNDDADVQEEPGPPAKLPRATPTAAKSGPPAKCPEQEAQPKPTPWAAVVPPKA